MQLFTALNSPFGARISIAAHAKRIDIPTAALPTGGLGSAEYRALNPLMKIPALMLDDGAVVPESETILRYLEHRFPLPSLYPANADERARIDCAVRIMDLYVMAPVIRLFPHLGPAGRNIAVVEREVVCWRAGLAALAYFLRDPLPHAPAGVSLADCVIAPSLHLGTRIAAKLQLPADPVTEHAVLTDYYRVIARHPIVGPILDSLTLAQEEKDMQTGLPSLAAYHRAVADLTYP